MLSKCLLAFPILVFALDFLDHVLCVIVVPLAFFLDKFITAEWDVLTDASRERRCKNIFLPAFYLT